MTPSLAQISPSLNDGVWKAESMPLKIQASMKAVKLVCYTPFIFNFVHKRSLAKSPPQMSEQQTRKTGDVDEDWLNEFRLPNNGAYRNIPPRIRLRAQRPVSYSPGSASRTVQGCALCRSDGHSRFHCAISIRYSGSFPKSCMGQSVS